MKKIDLLSFSPRKLLWSAALVGLVLMVIVLLFPILYRDSVNYMASVNALWLQNWRTAFNITYVPLLFCIAAIFKPLGLDANQCLTLVSSMCTIGLLYPGYRVLSHFFDRKFAAWGSVLFFISPKIVSVGFVPLTDSARWFCTLFCLMIVLDYIQNRKKYLLFLLGIFYAAFALVRSEGIVFVGLISMWFWVEQIHQVGWREGWRKCYKYVGPVLLPLVVMGVLLIPRFWQIYQETGYAALDTRQTWAIKAVVERIFPGLKSPVGADTVTYGADVNYHSFWTDIEWHLRYWGNLFTSNYVVYVFFTILGFVYIIREKKWQYCHSLFCCFVIVNAAIYMLMRSCAGRYFIINIFFLMPFTIQGMVAAWALVQRFAPPVIKPKLDILLPYALAALFLILPFSGIKRSFSKKTAHYYKIGEFMQQQKMESGSRSGTGHPVYLIWGDNYGWGLFCDGNELVYSDQYYVKSKYSVEHILQHGLPPEYCSFAVDPLKDVKMLKPDYLLDSRDDNSALPAECQRWVELLPQSLTSKVKVYKVRPPQNGN